MSTTWRQSLSGWTLAWSVIAISIVCVKAARGQFVEIYRVDGDDGAANGDGSAWGSSAFKYLADAVAFAAQRVDQDPTLNQVQLWVARTGSNNPYLPDRSASFPGGTGNRVSSFSLHNKVAIYGGIRGADDSDPNNPYPGESFRHERNPEQNTTVLSGNIGSPTSSTDNSWHVMTAVSVNSSAVLSGFTIQDGNANSPGNSSGGGLFASNSRASISRCVFRKNSAAGGGAIYNQGPVAESAQFVNCSFFDNEAIDGSGGAIWSLMGRLALTNCVFAGNAAGNFGGAISMDEHDVTTLRNCTIANNEALEGGGIWCAVEFSTDVVLTNCIVWDNIPEGLHIEHGSGGSFEARYCDIQGLVTFPGERNILVIPGFCNPSGDNYRLSDASSCRNVGNDSDVPSDGVDLNDNGNSSESLPWDRSKANRIFEVVDLGAYENQHDPSCPTDVDHDGSVGIFDLTQLLACYGKPAEGECAAADFDCDGVVGLGDLSLLLSSYGDCELPFSRPSGSNADDDESAFFQWAQQASIEELLDWYRAFQGESR